MIHLFSRLMFCGIACAVLGACAGGGSPSASGFGRSASLLKGRLIITLDDGDTPPQVYESGQILLREPSAIDTATLLRLPLPASRRREQIATFSQMLVPSALQGGPSSISINAQGTRVLVTARFDSAPPQAVDVGQLPPSQSVSLIDISDGQGRIIETYDLCAQPSAVSFDSTGTRAAVLGRAAHELVIVEIHPEGFGVSYRLPLEQIFGRGCEPTDVQWQPGSDIVAVTLGGSAQVAFFSVLPHPNNRFEVQLIEAIEAGIYPNLARWLLDGSALVVCDSGWYQEFLNRYTPDPSGALLLITPPIENMPARIEAAVPLTIAPASLAISPSGRFIAAVSMRKDDMSRSSGQLGGRLSLFLHDAGTKTLVLLDSVRTGSLPHDVAFDASGRGLLVAEFQSGALEVFEITTQGGLLRLIDTSVRVETNYGVHAVRVVP